MPPSQGIAGAGAGGQRSKKPLLALPAPEDVGQAGVSATTALVGGNGRLPRSEVDALQVDDFLLGRSDGRRPLCEEDLRWTSVDDAVQQVDAALRQGDVAFAEALWRRAADAEAGEATAASAAAAGATGAGLDPGAGAGPGGSGSASMGVGAGVLRAVPHAAAAARRVGAALCEVALDELEAALDRGDRPAAQREHQRVHALVAACTRLTGGPPDDAWGRRPELEARFRQLCGEGGSMMCSLFPDVWSLCWAKTCALPAVPQLH